MIAKIVIQHIQEICQKRLAEKPKAGEMRKRNFEKINSVLPRLHKAINSNVYDKKDVQYKPVSNYVSEYVLPLNLDSHGYYLDTKKKIQ